jgi:hypothetical protein
MRADLSASRSQMIRADEPSFKPLSFFTHSAQADKLKANVAASNNARFTIRFTFLTDPLKRL